MELSNWAPEHSDALRELIAKGMSFSEAARAINSRFNTSYTRSAALGRARRLGLGPDDRRQPSMPTRPAELHEIVEPASQSISGRLRFPGRCRSSRRSCRSSCVASGIEPRHLSLIELGARRLPLSLWRRRRGRGHHLLRSSAPRGFKLLQPAFSLEPQSGRAARWTVRFAAAGEGGMKKTAVNCVADRLKRLPRGHRIAHLRALIGLQPEGCGRRDELSELLREEIATHQSNRVSD